MVEAHQIFLSHMVTLWFPWVSLCSLIKVTREEHQSPPCLTTGNPGKPQESTILWWVHGTTNGLQPMGYIWASTIGMYYGVATMDYLFWATWNQITLNCMGIIQLLFYTIDWRTHGQVNDYEFIFAPTINSEIEWSIYCTRLCYLTKFGYSSDYSDTLAITFTNHILYSTTMTGYLLWYAILFIICYYMTGHLPWYVIPYY